MIRALAGLLCLGGATVASAADRSITVTDFDRIRVDGSYLVQVVTGKAGSARVSGSPQAIEHTRVEASGRLLRIGPNMSAWGGWPGEQSGPVTIRLTAPALSSVLINGASDVTVDRMRAAEVSVGMQGSGKLKVGRIEADRATISVLGAGALVLAGKVAQLRVVVRGDGDLDGTALVSSDIRVTSEGSGNIRLPALRSADVTSSGSGDVTVLGTPACTVHATGSGRVVCGRTPLR